MRWVPASAVGRVRVGLVRAGMVTAGLVVALAAGCADGSARPTETRPTETHPTETGPVSDEAPAAGVAPNGFELAGARVTGPDGSVCELCLWIAATDAQRRLGLMGVTDLGPADGMAFVYDSPHTGSFWMKNTVMPLSIAFFAPDGVLLDAFDMEPCTEDPCPGYPTPTGFLVAVETEQGRLADLGITPGSSLELLDLPCEP